MGVTVVGSFEDDIAFDKVRMSMMMRETVRASIDKMQEIIRHKTPVGLDHTHDGIKHPPGHLRDSVSTKGPRHISKDTWQGEVYSDLNYAAAIEYGMSPRVVTAKHGGKLAFLHDGKLVVVTTATNKGWAGSHMFQKGSAEFDRVWAERIARNKAHEWLGAVDAGRSIAVI